ncbi:MIEF1 upstream protein [Holothuria leucospilota]|uniref:MIEF1 upstream protein n=1 Tax=Holothuria leucospilota TaxID=206669 RepID=A0A9Q0YL19_HOLLE|nr:MIEF1 upstream protein [Holothuria leucospilota]
MASTTVIPWSRRAVLSLYKSLLREGERLQYTDQNFFRRSVRQEFEKVRHESENAERQRQLNVKGYYLLSQKLGGLV